MLAGGAEELDAIEAAVFDTLFATSVKNDSPRSTPRPFDSARDGLVLGEGACTLVLEELEHARARGARILAEVLGYGTNSDGAHVTQPNPRPWRRRCGWRWKTRGPARRSATSTRTAPPPTMATSPNRRPRRGAGRARADQLAEELHGPHAGRLRRAGSMDDDRDDARGLVRAHRQSRHGRSALRASSTTSSATGRELQTDLVMSNNFAFGGINTSLVFRRWPD